MDQTSMSHENVHLHTKSSCKPLSMLGKSLKINHYKLKWHKETQLTIWRGALPTHLLWWTEKTKVHHNNWWQRNTTYQSTYVTAYVASRVSAVYETHFQEIARDDRATLLPRIHSIRGTPHYPLLKKLCPTISLYISHNFTQICPKNLLYRVTQFLFLCPTISLFSVHTCIKRACAHIFTLCAPCRVIMHIVLSCRCTEFMLPVATDWSYIFQNG